VGGKRGDPPKSCGEEGEVCSLARDGEERAKSGGRGGGEGPVCSRVGNGGGTLFSFGGSSHWPNGEVLRGNETERRKSTNLGKGRRR